MGKKEKKKRREERQKKEIKKAIKELLLMFFAGIILLFVLPTLLFWGMIEIGLFDWMVEYLSPIVKMFSGWKVLILITYLIGLSFMYYEASKIYRFLVCSFILCQVPTSVWYSILTSNTFEYSWSYCWTFVYGLTVLLIGFLFFWRLIGFIIYLIKDDEEDN